MQRKQIHSALLQRMEHDSVSRSSRESHFTLINYVLCCAQISPTLCDPMHCSPPGCSVYGDSPGRNTIVGFHAIFQEIFPTQTSNRNLLHCRQILYQLSYQGSPMMQLGISIRGRILRNAVGMKTDTGALYLPFKELNSTSTLLQMALFHSVFYD